MVRSARNRQGISVAGKDRCRARNAASWNAVKDMDASGQERPDGIAIPAHLLVLVPAFDHDLVDG